MAYIPENAHWYIAEILEEMRIEGAVDKIVHRNLILIDADSPDHAYERAIELGRQEESSYKNYEGRDVRVRFLGLADLLVIHDELGHGAELAYTEQINRSVEDVSNLVRARGELSVFRDARELPVSLDYRDGEITREAGALLKQEKRRNPMS
jgi:hypothetical protein